MYNCAAIRQMTRTSEKKKHWYFPLRAIFILWTGSLQQHDISRAPGHMVPVSLEFLLLERLMKSREDQGVGGSSVGGGVLSRGAELSRVSISALHVSYAFLSACISCVFPLIISSCANSSTALGVELASHADC